MGSTALIGWGGNLRRKLGWLIGQPSLVAWDLLWRGGDRCIIPR
jgi:hypothetical protein